MPEDGVVDSEARTDETAAAEVAAQVQPAVPAEPPEQPPPDDLTPQPEKSAEAIKTFKFGMVMSRSEQTFHFPGLSDEYFFKAKAPDAKGAKRIEGALVAYRGDENNPTKGVGYLDPFETFLQKCLVQITGFALPQLDEAGGIVGKPRTFDPTRRGNNEANREAYEKLSPDTVEYMEGALDDIAGRGGELAEEYRRLKNGC